jgi:hypothetical protein
MHRLRWPAVIAAGTVAVFCCALVQARQMGVQSDGAAMVLQSWAMSHGNPLLHGWYVSDVSFYTTELPEYIVIEAVRGIRPDVVTIAAALTYTLLVLLAAAVAVTGGSSRRAGIAGAVITVAVMLGPVPAATNVLLNDPDHVGSAVPVLLALLIVDRLMTRPATPGARLALATAMTAVLGVAAAGDPLILLIGIAPLVAVCGGQVLWHRVLRRQPLAGVSAEFSLTVAGLLAAAIGVAAPRVIRAAGGYTIAPLTKHGAPPGMLPRNAAGLVENFLDLFSAWPGQLRANAWLAVTGVHLVFACLVAVALIAVLARFLRGADLVSRLLTAGIVANMTAYALLFTVTTSAVREIGPVFGLGAALAGRVLGEPALRLRLGRLVAVAAAAAVAAAVPTLLTVKPGTPMAADLAGFLDSHHLRAGLGGYWQSNNITVETGGRVTVTPVREQAGSGLVPYKWEFDSSRLTSGQNLNFVITTRPGGFGSNTVTEGEAVALFGKPDRVYREVPGYTILVWRKNLQPTLPRS